MHVWVTGAESLSYAVSSCVCSELSEIRNGCRCEGKDDIHSARSSSTGVLSEAPLLRHEKARKKVQQEAEMHKKMIMTLEGLIRSLVSLHGTDEIRDKQVLNLKRQHACGPIT